MKRKTKNTTKNTTHNEQYEELQKQYFSFRSKGNKKQENKCLSDMYLISKQVCFNYIKKYCKKNHLYHLDIDILSHDSAMYCIEKYLKNPSFTIQKISAYAYFGCLKNLFKDSEQQQKTISYSEMQTSKVFGVDLQENEYYET